MKYIEKVSARWMLKNLEMRPIGVEQSVYDYIYLVPTRRKHESGWMTVAIVGVMIAGKDRMGEIASFPDDINWIPTIEDGYNAPMRTDCVYPGGILRVWRPNSNVVVHGSYSSTDVSFRGGQK